MIMVVRQPSAASVTPRISIVRISATWPMLITGMIQLPGIPTPPAEAAVPRNMPVQLKKQIVDRRIDERHEPEHQDERDARAASTALSQASRWHAGGRRLRRRVRQRQAEDRQQQRGDAGDHERPLRARLQRRAGQPGAEHGAQPRDEPLRVGGGHAVPVDEDERHRPGRQNPSDRPAHAHDAEFLLRILHVGEGDRVRDRDASARRTGSGRA